MTKIFSDRDFIKPRTCDEYSEGNRGTLYDYLIPYNTNEIY